MQCVPIFLVRPAWAHSCGCKSHRKWITANGAKRNCEPMNKNKYDRALRMPADDARRILASAIVAPAMYHSSRQVELYTNVQNR